MPSLSGGGSVLSATVENRWDSPAGVHSKCACTPFPFARLPLCSLSLSLSLASVLPVSVYAMQANLPLPASGSFDMDPEGRERQSARCTASFIRLMDEKVDMERLTQVSAVGSLNSCS